MRARVRCWPNGRVIPSVEADFSTAPMVGDMIELVEFVALAVKQRRFDPGGRLTLWCDPEPGSDYTPEMIADAFDEVRRSA
jgi:hypothetical protein